MYCGYGDWCDMGRDRYRWRDIKTGYIGILNRGGRLVPTHYRLGSTQQGYFICCGNMFRWEQFDFPSIRRMILIVTMQSYSNSYRADYDGGRIIELIREIPTGVE